MKSIKLLKAIRKPFRRMRGVVAMRLGRASSSKPLSKDWGISRGQPIDRHYIDAFVSGYADDVRGRVLEIGDDNYSRQFGGSRIARQDILHLTGHPQATIVGDLAKPGLLPKNTFDCIICTQTLQFLFDIHGALDQLHQSLRPGGVLLVTVPGITPIGQGEWGKYWCWSLTETALRKLLQASFDDDDLSLRTYGNLVAATAFLHAAAVEETGRKRLAPLDPSYPVIVAARAVARRS
jgi:SAM-dependent methyltransferase